jgi:hypothetical protein
MARTPGRNKRSRTAKTAGQLQGRPGDELIGRMRALVGTVPGEGRTARQVAELISNELLDQGVSVKPLSVYHWILGNRRPSSMIRDLVETVVDELTTRYLSSPAMVSPSSETRTTETGRIEGNNPFSLP